nr:MAG TPA: hypothetical protein [Caudoviricetes sp.]
MDLSLISSPPTPRGRNTTFPLEILRFAQYDVSGFTVFSSLFSSLRAYAKRSNPANLKA